MNESFTPPSSQDNESSFGPTSPTDGCHWIQPGYAFYVATMTIACIGLPLTFVAIFAICLLVQKDHVAPIYVINLLICDLIQLSCMILMTQGFNKSSICQPIILIHQFGVTVSIFFMVVISLERYLIIAWPLWYKFKRNIKTSMIVSVVVWLLPLLNLPIFFFAHDYTETIIGCCLLLPFPLLIFFLGGTLKALSSARSVPPDEKRRIVAVLVLVLLIYTLLFLPRVILSLSEKVKRYRNFEIVTVLPLFFSPLADLFLYVFMRKGICDKLLASLCCCKMDHDDVTSVENVVTVHSDRPEQEERERKEEKKMAQCSQEEEC
ncbi:G-protein coupled receptor 4-like [Cololabis saira]|uniref:G-protein coupled receptor 4-like n=1 Tax=Cololabis saira TaxID=129043 RepID=UPI002AD20963|nr:G-protein coupled receptor 4-like [Cololabis saira]